MLSTLFVVCLMVANVFGAPTEDDNDRLRHKIFKHLVKQRKFVVGMSLVEKEMKKRPNLFDFALLNMFHKIRYYETEIVQFLNGCYSNNPTDDVSVSLYMTSLNILYSSTLRKDYENVLLYKEKLSKLIEKQEGISSKTKTLMNNALESIKHHLLATNSLVVDFQSDSRFAAAGNFDEVQKAISSIFSDAEEKKPKTFLYQDAIPGKAVRCKVSVDELHKL
ncbi:hypothetical protein EIN_171820 [Entamoeba invadens IP1]|uniref:Uncharacterized protein n=1 Tax=Entamoeba invadens IP1 TaxID=370355 RepID=A0A0A1TVT1_ENTIV|nr:hypothetical protein EIN_171820 [Entamoeba invadens IP1]ELP84587.1 hypothetical protein EIN_171820 [Entamoeba invadens IP1]|eukprot:XP_004183933.1 hypothetical protein EIN_171820 [Entamoeba invadens IP1]